MPFDDAEKERIRYHLGYLETQPAASIQLGIPRPIQTIFLVESAMSLIIPAAEDRCRRMIAVLDQIECKLQDALDFLVVKRVDSTEIREDHTDALEGEYYRWASRLADTLGVPLYPYAARFRKSGGVVAGSIPVSGG